MVHFAKVLAEEANAEWLPNFIDYAKLKKLIHKYKEVRYSSRQVLMITVTTYGIIIHVPTQLNSTEEEKFAMGKDLRPLKEQLEVLTSKVDQNHEIEEERMQKITAEFNKIELDPDKAERERAREQRFNKMRQLFGSEELLDVEEPTGNKMKVVAQMLARSSVCTRHFFRVLNKELTKVNRFFMKQEGRFLQRHILLMKQLSLMRMQNKFSKRKINKLKPAFKEHYKTLELLHRFRKLNHEGFKRIIKKYQKYTDNQVKKYFYDILNNQYFQASKVLETMKAHSEAISVAILYPDKGHKNAMNKLKLPPTSMTKKQLNSSFNTGFWLGASLILTIIWIVYYIIYYLPIETDIEAFRSSSSLYLYRLFLFPILLIFFIGLNVRIWNNYHINYIFIFELNPRHHISEMEILRLPLIWYTLWSICFIIFMIMNVIGFPYGKLVELAWIPVITLYGLLLFWLFNPLPFSYRSSRFWLIRTLLRIAFAPFYRVQFRDFWVADQLTSMGTFLFDMQFLICLTTQSIHYGSEEVPFCNVYVSIGIPILNMWPFYARCLQCFRRFKDTRQVIHLWNAGKYFSSILTLFIYLFDTNLFPPSNGKWSSIRTAWFLCNIFSTFYKLVWDLYVDWGLLHGFRKNENGQRPRYPLLRHDILFRQWIYYIAMLLNIFLRCLWIPLLLLKIYFPTVMSYIWIAFLVAVCEMFRRGIWNIFRLENEHLTNVGQFRVTRDIPLPMDNYSSQLEEKKTQKTTFERLISKIFFCFHFQKSFIDMEFDSDDEEHKDKEDHDDKNDNDLKSEKENNYEDNSPRGSDRSHSSEENNKEFDGEPLECRIDVNGSKLRNSLEIDGKLNFEDEKSRISKKEYDPAADSLALHDDAHSHNSNLGSHSDKRSSHSSRSSVPRGMDASRDLVDIDINELEKKGSTMRQNEMNRSSSRYGSRIESASGGTMENLNRSRSGDRAGRLYGKDSTASRFELESESSTPSSSPASDEDENHKFSSGRHRSRSMNENSGGVSRATTGHISITPTESRYENPREVSTDSTSFARNSSRMNVFPTPKYDWYHNDTRNEMHNVPDNVSTGSMHVNPSEAPSQYSNDNVTDIDFRLSDDENSEIETPRN